MFTHERHFNLMRNHTIPSDRSGPALARKLRWLLAFTLTGCTASGSTLPGTSVDVVAGSSGPATPASKPTPAPSSTPNATPTPAASAPSPTAAIPAAIVSNFKVGDQLMASWSTGVSGAIAKSAKPDVVGAFRFICNPSHNSYDDPIVYPGRKGASHLHTFFGNTKADANSTYNSLRTTGDSTCNNILNRSAYWIPAMMTPAGKVVMPDYVSIYYKMRPRTDPECKRMAPNGCIALPRGLRYVFGYNMNEPGKSDGFHFDCDGPGAKPAHYRNIPQAAKNCPTGARLGAVLSSADCWDGKNLDSPDHRSHMARPGYGWWGYLKCPATHPYAVPVFTLGAWYMTDNTLDRSGEAKPETKTWHLSSDRMAGMPWQTPGSTFHADWFGAWDDETMKMWMDNCIDKLLSCVAGDLGNGKQLKMFDGFKWNADPRLVDPPKL